MNDGLEIRFRGLTGPHLFGSRMLDQSDWRAGEWRSLTRRGRETGEPADETSVVRICFAEDACRGGGAAGGRRWRRQADRRRSKLDAASRPPAGLAIPAGR